MGEAFTREGDRRRSLELTPTYHRRTLHQTMKKEK